MNAKFNIGERKHVGFLLNYNKACTGHIIHSSYIKSWKQTQYVLLMDDGRKQAAMEHHLSNVDASPFVQFLRSVQWG